MTAEYVVTRMLDQRSREQYSAVAQAAIRYLTERLDDATQATVAGEMVTLN